MFISPPRRLQVVSMDMVPNRNILGGFSDRHSILDDQFAFFDGDNRYFMSKWNFLISSNRERRVVFHTPALQLLTAGDIFNGYTHLVTLGMNDKSNHSPGSS